MRRVPELERNETGSSERVGDIRGCQLTKSNAWPAKGHGRIETARETTRCPRYSYGTNRRRTRGVGGGGVE
jgi:hypothetical protein